MNVTIRINANGKTVDNVRNIIKSLIDMRNELKEMASDIVMDIDVEMN